jgi:hypothetical protein
VSFDNVLGTAETAGFERATSGTMISERIRVALACLRPQCACQRARARLTHCPSHSDRRPSLGVAERGGRVLVHCHAGCQQGAVLAALRARGLWPSRELRQHRPRRPRRELTPHELGLRFAAREPWRRPGVLALYEAADAQRLTDQVRRAARGDDELTWERLGLAAELTREARALEELAREAATR